MRRRFLSIVALFLFAGTFTRADEPTDSQPRSLQRPHFDSNGDPLPPGAIRRLGTVRFRGGGWGRVHLSPDGALLAFDDGEGIVRLCEFTTGKELRRVGRNDGRDSFGCFSPDSKRLATIGAHGRI